MLMAAKEACVVMAAVAWSNLPISWEFIEMNINSWQPDGDHEAEIDTDGTVS